MITNMKADWGKQLVDQIFHQSVAPYTDMIGCSALHFEGRRIVLHQDIAVSEGKLLNSDVEPNCKVIGLKATTSGNKLSIEALDLVSNETLIINL